MGMAVIFDMDGTMVDNMMVHHRAWQKVLKDLGLNMSIEEVRKEIHGVNHQILDRLFPDRFNKTEQSKICSEKELQYRKLFKSDLKLIDGLEDFLLKLKNARVPLGIGSAAPPENLDFVLDNLAIRGFFKSIRHSEDVKLGKPNPEIYLKVANDLERKPKECLVFEDTPTGAEAAYNARCELIVITTTHPKHEFSHIPNISRFIHDYKKMELDDLGIKI